MDITQSPINAKQKEVLDPRAEARTSSYTPFLLSCSGPMNIFHLKIGPDLGGTCLQAIQLPSG